MKKVGKRLLAWTLAVLMMFPTAAVTLAEIEEGTTAETTKDITINLGQEYHITDESGNYESTYTEGDLNKTIATVEVVGDSAGHWNLVTGNLDSGKYLIESYNHVKQTDDRNNNTVLTINDSNQLVTSGKKESYTEPNWTVEKADNGTYKIYQTNSNGNKYINIGNGTNSSAGTASASDTETSVTILPLSDVPAVSGRTAPETCWFIKNSDNWYLNGISPFGSWTGADDGSAWSFYQYELEYAKTNITITGKAEGTTSVTVGNTLYNITVQNKVANKPENGTTTGQPFNANTGGSSKFRIPAMVTTKNGTIVAAADARWNSISDSSGIDTLVSYSTDNGQNWSYTFANYLGDNKLDSILGSATFIDPNLTYKADEGENGTIYMLVDLYVASYAIAGGGTQPLANPGFTNEGYLIVGAQDERDGATASTYNYYVKDDKIYKISDNTVVDGYSVDPYFNLTDTYGNIVGNLFYADSAYQALPTTYLYLTKSTDNGATWSAPQLLDLKKTREKFYGVAPGTGLVTSDGTIMIPCYVYDGTAAQRSSFIYSSDNGATWNRTDNATYSDRWSSESQLVELNDGTIRMFFRSASGAICYVDAVGNADTGYTWGTYVNTGVANTSDCMISAIKYSKEINGKQAILLSCPTGGERKNGYIYVALVNGDNTLDFASIDKTLVSDSEGEKYQYSSMAELSDGSVAILYENGDASIRFKTFDADTLFGESATIGTEYYFAGTTTNKRIDNLTLVVDSNDSASRTVVLEGLNGADFTVTSENENIATAVKGENNSVVITAVGAGTTVVEARVTGNARATVLDSVKLNVTVVAANEIKTQDISIYVGEDYYIKDESGDYRDSYTGNGLDAAIAGVEISGTSGKNWRTVTEIKSGEKYLIESYQAATNNHTDTLLDYDSEFLLMNGKKDTATAEIWTVEELEQEGTYKIYKEADNYVNVGNKLMTSDTPDAKILLGSSISGATQPNRWYIKSTTKNSYLNYGTKLDTYSVADNGSSWNFYQYKDYHETYITFSGKQAGTTSVLVGTTRYNITVKEKPEMVNFENSPFIGVSTNAYGDMKITKLTTSVDVSIKMKVEDTDAEWAVTNPQIATITKNADGTVTIVGVSAGSTYLTVTTGGVTYTMPLIMTDFVTTTSRKSFIIYISEITDTTVYYAWNAGTDMTQAQLGETIHVLYDTDADVGISFFGEPDEGYALTRMSSTNSHEDYFNVHTGDRKTIDYTETGYYNGINNNKDGAGKVHVRTFGGTKVKQMLEAAMALNCDGAMGFTRPSGDGYYVDSNLRFRSRKLPTLTKKVVGILGSDGMAASYREYYEGMSGTVGEYIFFQIDVQKYEDEESESEGKKHLITYEDVVLTDMLETTYFIDPEKQAAFNETGELVIPELNDEYQDESGHYCIDLTDKVTASAENPDVYTFYVVYRIVDEDLGKEIINTVDLEYGYRSNYSMGAMRAASEATASIIASEFKADDIIVDFGIPVTTQIKPWGTNDVTLTSGHASYGEVSVSGTPERGWQVTYTPTETIKTADVVVLEGHDEENNPKTYAFHVYPATTVYYEENFAAYTGEGWSSQGTAKENVQQAASAGMTGAYQYGYDSAYTDDNAGASNGTEQVSAKRMDSATFAFTGTGVEIYTNNAEDTGKLFAEIYAIADNGDRTFKKMYWVDTAMKDGDTNNTAGQVMIAYNVPVISVRGLEHGNYEVVIKNVSIEPEEGTTASIKLDGFRVYGTMENQAESYYVTDKENNPTFIKMRDTVLTALQVNTNDAQNIYAEQIAMGALNQIYNAVGTDEVSAVLIQSDATQSDEPASSEEASGSEDTETDSTKITDVTTDLLVNGPKNEIYLQPGSALVFSLNTNKAAQIGLKALNGNVSYSVKIGEQDAENRSLNTSTDMFYKLLDNRTETAPVSVTIANNSTNGAVLSITLLKVCGEQTQAAVFGTLTQRDLTNALVALGYKEKKVISNPFKDVKFGAYYYNAVMWALENEITSGLTEDMFGTAEECTRAQVVTFLWRMAGTPDPVGQNNPFSDVSTDENSKLRKAILWAYEQGYVSGYTNGTFRPDRTITRAEFVAILYRVCDGDDRANIINPFVDVDEKKHEKFIDAIIWAYDNEITLGKDAEHFQPDVKCSRANVVTFLYRANEKNKLIF